MSFPSISRLVKDSRFAGLNEIEIGDKIGGGI